MMDEEEVEESLKRMSKKWKLDVNRTA